MRKIVHIDMDAFYASVEQRDHVSLRGKPIAVGHSDKRGVIAAASYEARAYGVRSAMPSIKAKRLCPDLIFVPGRREVYKQVSEQMHAIFHEYTDLIEPISLDEAFLDVTTNKKGIELGVEVAKEIKEKILKELLLTASAGVSYNKFLAKIASDVRKPDGLCTIHPSQALSFIEKLPISSFWGVGPVTAKRMHKLGIHTGLDLRKCDKSFLVRQFGKMGLQYYSFARGIDHREVEAERVRKSVGCEQTLDKDLSDKKLLAIELYHVAKELESRLKKSGFKGYTVTLKVKFHDFEQITRSITLQRPVSARCDYLPLAKQMLRELDLKSKAVRLIGITISNSVELREEEAVDWKQLKLNFKER